uniref:Uncharacterized protein n=1 Tax=Chromera velia CCMP2878 TaxID=1169474 RepID=A0A0G4GA79_9ALVE|mmetsp:Transcript_42626/g.84068  ORF Transcript_42626/g.84068 Transcript_42626/m.84068 type:complete len:129 (+) Transcript_42626:79-465(+)|eukprot:Cvel_20856.t1-p1 / transcript=Cvel_20856.t1 / gene=Cvel_20856 / organism=Chromera_velia_CCMP2878 / gene_product=Tctex1 domain-containing protein 2, putative / transcript_product=Tctex1 domain-containing protein 2, putative / location=Cvel_scaffold1911:12724-14280(+) / protein_length=128 / sequence_SO=supercontig / SO=protein_coding / is_pseudo=false
MAANQVELQVWENTYRLEPEENEKFFPSKVEGVIADVMKEMLADKEYNSDSAKIWTLELCNEIKARCKDLNMPRYKLIVQVVIGENAGQGIRVSSKCLWDVNLDNWASYSYRNQSLFAVGMVFGCYYE